METNRKTPLGNFWDAFGFLIYVCAVFVFNELLLRVSSLRHFEFAGFAVLFNVITALFVCCVLAYIPPKPRAAAANAVLSLTALLYISQIIYNNVFSAFYNLESMSNAGQIVEFWPVILRAARQRLLYIILCLAPIPVYNIFIRKKAVVPGRYRRILLCAVPLYIALLTAFISFARSPGTTYSAFFGQQSFESSIKRIGLLSAVQTDLLKLFINEGASGTLTVLERPHEPPALKPRDESGKDRYPLPPPAPDIASGGSPADIAGSPPPEPVVYGYNVMDIDFESLIAGESDRRVAALHEYFISRPPTRKNEFTGMFAGYNLIKIVAEAFSPFAVDEELTPTLYKLVHEGFHFTNFYTPVWGVSTSDGEYVACLGLLPKSGVWSFSRSSGNYLPFAMGNQLRKQGYHTAAYHNHSFRYYNRHLSHPNMGYDYKGVGNGLILPQIRWPNSDLEMMEATVDELIDNQPFHAYYLTVSGHLEYNFTGNAMAARNREAVAHLPLSDPCKAYIACNIELDKALEYLLRRLEEAGIAGNTLIVLSSDHYPYGLIRDGFDGISEFLGRPVERNFELFKNNLIIYSEGMEPMTVDKFSSSLDIIPTVSNLLGLEFDSRLLMGQDIFSDSEPLVVFNNRSFITGKGFSVRGRDFTPHPGIEVEDGYREYINSVIEAMFTASARMLDFDYYRKVFQ